MLSAFSKSATTPIPLLFPPFDLPAVASREGAFLLLQNPKRCQNHINPSPSYLQTIKTKSIAFRTRRSDEKRCTCCMSGSLTGARKISMGGVLSIRSDTNDSRHLMELESKSWILPLSKIRYCRGRTGQALKCKNGLRRGNSALRLWEGEVMEGVHL